MRFQKKSLLSLKAEWKEVAFADIVDDLTLFGYESAEISETLKKGKILNSSFLQYRLEPKEKNEAK